MKAWISGEASGMAHVAPGERAMPEPGARDLLVRVLYGALNFSDVLMIEDGYQVRPPRPFVLGQELVGVVEQAPAGSVLRPGDTVAGKVDWGAFAEYALLREDMAIPVPAGFSPAQAAALPVSYLTAMVALVTCGELKAGETVLVHAAAGAVGLASVEIAVAMGARVIATAGAVARLAPALARGAAHGVSYGDSDWYGQVKDLTGGQGADVIVDPVGGQVGEDSLRCIARDGRLLIVGFASGRMPRLAANRLLLKRASARGVYWNHDRDGPMLAEMTRRISDLAARGAISPLIGETYPFADLPRALADLAGRKVTGKALLRMGEAQ